MCSPLFLDCFLKCSCFKFVITDAGGNGISGNNGEGYYRILNSNGDVIVDGSGDFGAEASHLLSINFNGTSINETVDNNVKIYPNPTRNEVMVQCDGMKKISLATVSGQTLDEMNVDADKYTLDMRSYNPGVYFINVTTENRNFVIKVLRTN